MPTLRLPVIALLGTGGTIAATANQSTVVVDYAVTQGVQALLSAVPDINTLASLRPQQVFNVDSRCIDNAMLLQLGATVQALLDDPGIDGIVITHGTDTLEETAYFLNLVVKSHKPVVVVGAMRPGSALSADGPLNLYNAVLLATTPQAKGMGVLVTLNDTVHAARYVHKAHTTDVQAFSSHDQGSLGHIHNGRVFLSGGPLALHSVDTEFSMQGLQSLEDLPLVDVLYDHQHAGLHLYRASISAGARGIVVAACGNGSLTTHAEQGCKLATEQGIVCVRSTRTGAGMVSPSALDVERRMVSSNTLHPQKARILLMLALTRSSDPAAIQACFDRY